MLAAAVRGSEAASPVATEVVTAAVAGGREEVVAREAHGVGLEAKAAAARGVAVMVTVVAAGEASLAAAGPVGGTDACMRGHPAAQSPSTSAAPRDTGSSYLRRSSTAATVVAAVRVAAVTAVDQARVVEKGLAREAVEKGAHPVGKAVERAAGAREEAMGAAAMGAGLAVATEAEARVGARAEAVVVATEAEARVAVRVEAVQEVVTEVAVRVVEAKAVVTEWAAQEEVKEVEETGVVTVAVKAMAG